MDARREGRTPYITLVKHPYHPCVHSRRVIWMRSSISDVRGRSCISFCLYHYSNHTLVLLKNTSKISCERSKNSQYILCELFDAVHVFIGSSKNVLKEVYSSVEHEVYWQLVYRRVRQSWVNNRYNHRRHNLIRNTRGSLPRTVRA